MEKTKTDLERLYDGGIHYHMDWIDVTRNIFHNDIFVKCDYCDNLGDDSYSINNKIICHVCKLRGK